MAEDQKTLVANYVNLWEAGELQLKPLAAHYRTVVGTIFAAEAGVDLLWRPAEFGGPYGPVRGAWQSLTETALTLLQETAENLADTGEVLVMASREYVEADRVNADAIRAEMNERIDANASNSGLTEQPGPAGATPR